MSSIGQETTLTVNPCTPYGAVIRGLDIAKGALAAGQVTELLAYLDEYHVLIFRGHSSPEDAKYLEFVSSFGEVELTDIVPNQVRPERPEIVIISNDVKEGASIGPAQSASALDWHSDYCWQERVSQIGSIEALELPVSGGGETWFSNMYAVYEALDPAVRERLWSLSGLHIRDTTSPQYEGSAYQPLRQAEHPLVMTHPSSGRRALYVNHFYTARILGLSEVESRSMLDEFFALANEPRFIYEHHWELGDLVIWDQLGLVHGRNPFDTKERRCMRQITVAVSNIEAPWPVRTGTCVQLAQ